MTARSQAHHDFTLERTFPVPVEKVWAAFADEETKRLWFAAENEVLSMTAYEEDFRVGGHGMNEGSFHGGPPHRFQSTYTDIVDLERIIYTYDMWIGDTHISTSITTIMFEPLDGGTRLTLTEQGVHLDGYDNGEQRELGTAGLLDDLGATLVA
ncbi:MAG: SRPBCC family protein [Aeromicrobium sp.]